MTTTTMPARHDSSPRIARFNAWFFDAFDGLIDWSLRRLKRDLYRDLPDEIVEIGPGVGANFRYYRPGTTVIAIEPNEQMHERLIRNAQKAGIDLVLRRDLAEHTGLGGESADVVISCLVLCTVEEPETAVSEALRILRPGGRLILLEHILGRGPALRLVQRLVARPWRWLFEGCELSRDTAEIVRTAGFSSTEIAEKTHLTVFVPVNSVAYGVAVK